MDLFVSHGPMDACYAISKRWSSAMIYRASYHTLSELVRRLILGSTLMRQLQQDGWNTMGGMKVCARNMLGHARAIADALHDPIDLPH